MKTGKAIIVVAIMMLIATTQAIEAKAQWDNQTVRTTSELPETAVKLNESKERTPFSTTDSNSDSNNGPYKAPPGGSGDGQKLPVRGGFWILVSLAIAYALTYGIVCRKKQKKID